MDYHRKEIGAGLLVLTALILFIGMIFLSSNLVQIFKEKKEYKVLFTHAEGIDKTTPVKRAGITVGKVKEIGTNSEYPGMIQVIIRISMDTEVRLDSSIEIRQELLGDKYIEITAGSESMPDMAPGEVVIGKTAISITDVTNILVGVATDVKDIVAEIKGVVATPEFSKNIEATTQNIESLTRNLDDLLKDKRPDIDAMISNLSATTRELRRLVQQVQGLVREADSMIADTNQNLNTLLKDINKTQKDLVKEMDVVLKNVNDPLVQNKDNINKIMENLEKMTSNLVLLTDEMNKRGMLKVMRKGVE